MKDYSRAFTPKWFHRHQRSLLWFLNAPLVRYWARYVLRIHGFRSGVGHNKILRIEPDSITWEAGSTRVDRGWCIRKVPVYRTEYRTHAKFSKRVYHAFKAVWWTMHFWDWAFADWAAPQLSFGFDTLTVSPVAGEQAGTPVDGTIERNATNETWGTIRSGAGTAAGDTWQTGQMVGWFHGNIADRYSELCRGFFHFNTSGLTAAATISAAIIKLSQQGGNNLSHGSNPSFAAYQSTVVANDDLTTGDFNNVGSTIFSDSYNFSSWLSNSSYMTLTLNSDGRNNISKTGVSKFATRSDKDANNVQPTNWANGSAVTCNVAYADSNGTSVDPILEVTYSVIVPNRNFFAFM